MANPYFRFKQFTVFHDRSAMKVTTDACLFGAWCADVIMNLNPPVENVLDIGTGTGLLSLMIEQKNKIRIDAVEIEEESAAQALENFTASPWKKNLQVITTDIQRLEADKKYDCIVSNPPFYENELNSRHQKKNLAHHSAQLTLIQLLTSIKTHLKENGVFFLLLPYKRVSEIEKILQNQGFFIHRSVIVQQSLSHQPFRFMLMASSQEMDSITSTLSICIENQQYSPEFTALLKDYYLYL